MNKLKKIWAFLKKSFSKIKNPYWRAKQRYIKYYDTLPIDNKMILLESEHGKKLNGNIFYLVQYFSRCEDMRDYKIYVSCCSRYRTSFLKMLEVHGIQNVHICIYSSDEYFRILASAKFLINDTTFGSYYIKKEGQIYFNTWHGTPFKAMGRRTENEKHLIGNVQKNFIISDYILTPNEQTYYALFHDYMLENITEATAVYCGYPRNAIFFDKARQQEIRQEINPDGKKMYAYMPTFRGDFNVGWTEKNDAYLKYYLFELDKSLGDDEILLVNLHPLSKRKLSFQYFKHIQEFSPQLETYEVLSVCDCLITDYSSVFFDYAVTQRKIVLFPYDYDDYLADRGTYLSFDSLPFSKVFDVPALIHELRSPKNYDDTKFLETYCPYESADAVERLFNYLWKGETTGLSLKKPERNGKENVLLFSGNIRKNGITSAFTNLINAIDLDKRNYYITFKQGKSPDVNSWLEKLPPEISYIPMTGDMDLTLWNRSIRILFKAKVLSAAQYVSINRQRICQDRLRCFGSTDFRTVIEYNGYEKESALFFSLFPANRVIYVHSNMLEEIKTRNNQRRDVLGYIYNSYNTVAVVSPSLVEPTGTFVNHKENIQVCKNLVSYETIRKRGEAKIMIDDTTMVFPSRDDFFNTLSSAKKKFISVGRFSPEKGHKRLISAFKRYLQDYPDSVLIIMGGNSLGNTYHDTIQHIEELQIQENVILLLGVSNPFPIIKACDGFILSSFYEGLPVVITEADVLGVPVVSTNIAGTRLFVPYGGTQVQNSENGLFEGFCLLGEGRVPLMSLDYEEYNKTAISEFESLFE